MSVHVGHNPTTVQDYWFTGPELEFLDNKWASDKAQALMCEGGRIGRLNVAAAVNWVVQDFLDQFVSPYPGETDEEFKRHVRRTPSNRWDQLKQIPPETAANLAQRKEKAHKVSAHMSTLAKTELCAPAYLVVFL